MRRLVFALLALVAFGGTASADDPFYDCTAPDFAQIAKVKKFVCHEIRRVDLNFAGATLPVRTVRAISDDRSEQYEPGVVTAVEASLDKFSELGGLGYGPITIVFESPYDADPKGNYASMRTLPHAKSETRECIVTVNTLRHDADKNAKEGSDVLLELNSTLAHELFHCVQHWNWNDRLVAGASWWREGTAEFMGQYVFESPPTIASRGTEFAVESGAKALTKITYPNVVFFSWLVNTKGIGAIVDFMNDMPTTAGEQTQQAALVAAIGDVALTRFVADYADGKVTSPKGTVFAPPKPDPALVVFAAGQSQFQTEPFSILIQDIAFRGGQYMASLKTASQVLSKRTDGPPANWEQPFMLSADGPCDKDKTFRIAVFNTADDILMDTQQISMCETCSVYGERDACVVGQWRINNDSLRDAMMEYLGDEVEELQISGFGGMNARADGTHSFAFNQLVIEGKPSTNAEAVAFLLGMHGTIDSNWGTGAGNLAMCYRTSNAVIQTKVPGGESEPINFADLMIGAPDNQYYRYQCNGPNEMFLTIDIPGQDKITIRLDRVG